MKKTLPLLGLILAFLLGLSLPAKAYRDLETGTFITKDPTADTLMMPKEKWMVDGREVSAQEYQAALNQGVAQAGNGPSKTAKDTGHEADFHVTTSEVGAGPKNVWHTAAAGFPNLYTYVNENPWTFFDPEGLDPITVSPEIDEAARQASHACAGATKFAGDRLEHLITLFQQNGFQKEVITKGHKNKEDGSQSTPVPNLPPGSIKEAAAHNHPDGVIWSESDIRRAEGKGEGGPTPVYVERNGVIHRYRPDPANEFGGGEYEHYSNWRHRWVTDSRRERGYIGDKDHRFHQAPRPISRKKSNDQG